MDENSAAPGVGSRAGEPRMELRARAERAIFVGGDREIDPVTLPLAPDLAADLDEWARVAGAVERTDPDSAGPLVSRRGRQLAARVADAMNAPISYVDPLSGAVAVVEPTTASAEPGGQAEPGKQAGSDTPGGSGVSADEPGRAAGPAEPTPWGTGLMVSAFALTLVVFAVVTLTATLSETSPLLALGAMVVVTAGMLPSVWLTRSVPVWRWVAFGVVGGIFAGWVALPFMVFG